MGGAVFEGLTEVKLRLSNADSEDVVSKAGGGAEASLCQRW